MRVSAAEKARDQTQPPEAVNEESIFGSLTDFTNAEHSRLPVDRLKGAHWRRPIVSSVGAYQSDLLLCVACDRNVVVALFCWSVCYWDYTVTEGSCFAVFADGAHLLCGYFLLYTTWKVSIDGGRWAIQPVLPYANLMLCIFGVGTRTAQNDAASAYHTLQKHSHVASHLHSKKTTIKTVAEQEAVCSI